MRHFLFSGAVATHPCGMHETALPAVLVAPPCGQNRRAPGRARATGGAILLATVAATANEHLHAAPGTQEEAGHVFHRLAPSSRTKMDNRVRQMGYSNRIHCSGLQGATHENLPVLGCRAHLFVATPFYPSVPGLSSLDCAVAWTQHPRHLETHPSLTPVAGHVVRPDGGRPPAAPGQATQWPELRRRPASPGKAFTGKNIALGRSRRHCGSG